MHIERLTSGILSICGILTSATIIYSIWKTYCVKADVNTAEAQTNIIGSTIYIPIDSLFKINGLEPDMVDTLNTSFRFICYIDSSSCSTCTITKARIWDGIVALTRKHNVDVQPIFILHASSFKAKNLIAAVNSSRIKYDIYLDTLGLFQRSNKWVTQYETHVVLINKNHEIVFMGDPTQSEITQNEYFNFIEN